MKISFSNIIMSPYSIHKYVYNINGNIIGEVGVDCKNIKSIKIYIVQYKQYLGQITLANEKRMWRQALVINKKVRNAYEHKTRNSRQVK